MQQPQPFGGDIRDEKIDTGRVAARPGKAGDKTQLDRICTDAENDRDRRGRSFGRKRSWITAGNSDNGHVTADEVGHERLQAIVLAVQPVVLHSHVLALDVASFVEGYTERTSTAYGGFLRLSTDDADHRHRRLLRASCEWPRDCRAAEKANELTSPHIRAQAPGPAL